MIDLAPHNPYSAPLRSPVLIGAGCLLRELDLRQVGALLTTTTTVHTRPLPTPTWASVPAGVVYSHQPLVSVRTLLRDEARRWRSLPAPVFVTILGNASELSEIAGKLDGVEGVTGFVVVVEDDPLATGVRLVRQKTLLPLLAVLPLDPMVDEAARAAVQAGADSLVVAAPPKGIGYQAGQTVSGRVYGPAVVPLVLQALTQLATAVDAPLIARGGIGDIATARAYLAAGATALLVDAARWGDPFAPQRLAEAL